MDIYLMRHGETDWNKNSRFQGRADIPLNEFGRELAQITSEGLKDIPFDAAFASPLNRAFETAKIVLRDRNIPLTIDERLIEVSFGVREGCNYVQACEDISDPIHDFMKHPSHYIAPEGAESFNEIYKRSAEFMELVLKPLEKKYKTILIVAHGALNRSIINQIANIPLDEFWSTRLPNCAVSHLTLNNGIFQVLEASHIYYQLDEK